MATRLHYLLPIARELAGATARRLRPGGLASRLQVRPGATPLILVAGSGRSGTSATARVLHESGVRMGDELAQASDVNPDGFYEDMGVWRLHDRMFAELGLSGMWSATRWPWRSTVLAVAFSYRDEMASLAAGALDGWKEPRFALTLEAWLPLLPVPPKVVVCLRSPAAYAESVTRVFGLVDADAAERQWARHYRRLLDVIRDYRLEATCVEYNALVEQPEETVARLARFVGRSLDASYVEPALRRYEAPVPQRYAALYAEVRALAPDAPRLTSPAATPSTNYHALAVEDYVARTEPLAERARETYAAWTARVAMPRLERGAAARDATAACSAALHEAQRELASLAPPASMTAHFELTKREVDLQRMVAECALAMLTGDPPDPRMEKATREAWRRFGRPEAIDRLEAKRRRALERALNGATA